MGEEKCKKDTLFSILLLHATHESLYDQLSEYVEKEWATHQAEVLSIFDIVPTAAIRDFSDWTSKNKEGKAYSSKEQEILSAVIDMFTETCGSLSFIRLWEL